MNRFLCMCFKIEFKHHQIRLQLQCSVNRFDLLNHFENLIIASRFLLITWNRVFNIPATRLVVWFGHTPSTRHSRPFSTALVGIVNRAFSVIPVRKVQFHNLTDVNQCLEKGTIWTHSPQVCWCEDENFKKRTTSLKFSERICKLHANYTSYYEIRWRSMFQCKLPFGQIDIWCMYLDFY